MLDRYAERVESDNLGVLHSVKGLHATLDALIDFPGEDPRMETGSA